MKKFGVTILFNKSSEGRLTSDKDESDKDTEISAKEIKDKLNVLGYQSKLFAIDRSDLKNKWRFSNEIVFNLIEWAGNDVPYAMKAIEKLEDSRTVFTGCGSKAYFMNCSKYYIKTILEKYNILTPDWQIINSDTKIIKKFKYPVIVKPVTDHCSLGISYDNVVFNQKELMKRDNEMLVEEFIYGREIHVTVIEKMGKLVVLPPAEIVFGKSHKYPILTFDSKWNDNSDEFKELKIKDAALSDNIKKEVNSVSKKCFRVSGARDYARLDLRIRGNDVFVLEINTNPSIDFTEQGTLGWSAKKAGLSYEKFLQCIIDNSLFRSRAERTYGEEYATE